MTHRLFLLSPASCAGRRARLLLEGRGTFPLAERLRAGGSAPLGQVFSFLSGLYFRGKLAYALAFGAPPHGCAPGLIITSDRGLVGPDALVDRADLAAFGRVPIDAANQRYTTPLRRDAEALLASSGADTGIVLLGSIASGKYVDVLLDLFGERLLFPAEFVGRGDMSRGGLLLRCVEARQELACIPVAGATRRGARPAKLEARPRAVRGRAGDKR